ncbi:cytochrome P450 [Mycolicibacterium litorale]|uniref:Cytochrome P450 monooxygenase n=1 Tax=Mycolicibacterium litorale TaxID=758802 RepID=A0AAD1IMA8_9MYCO|nr:cytochrome P450 [Mycolicibacterium litorale]MCV7416733.1 cytochrome P450 [Mycolicibacterium litorale]TDY09985.1 cytochrome P450 [Mycolicibacterium litorale]BBY17945.1 cytochrome P450 monooxygenase [Mycolicibacterium litorale]
MGHRLTGVRAAATLADLGSASIAAGVIARRKPAVRALETVQADARAVRRMQLLRDEFGAGPVELVLPGRRMVVVLDPDDVARVLSGAPDPFHPANREKRKALEWFQPHGVLISQGPIRQQRRVLNDSALDSGADMHRLAGAFADVITAEARELVDAVAARGSMDADQFMAAWWRIVRRLALGDRARDDEEITDALLRLRRAGNWSFLSLPHYRKRAKFLQRLYEYVEDPQIGTLAAAVADVPTRGAVDPVGQLPQWLFAFDAAGMAQLRALALLATHPDAMVRAIEDAVQPEQLRLRPFLRASVLESVRLWPTTPTILRETTEDTTWRNGAITIEKGAGLMIVTPAFHRDPDLLPFAHDFVPDIWLDGRARSYPQLVPFSAGPAECPGRNLVLFATSTLLANLLSALDFRLSSTPQLSPNEPLPVTLNQYGVEFAVQPVASSAPGPVTSSL